MHSVSLARRKLLRDFSFKATGLDVVLIKDILDHAVGRAVQVSWVGGDIPCFDPLGFVISIGLRSNHLARFQADCDDHTRSDICAAPTLEAAPEFESDRKVAVLHVGSACDAPLDGRVRPHGGVRDHPWS